jgi:hypothetical protein
MKILKNLKTRKILLLTGVLVLDGEEEDGEEGFRIVSEEEDEYFFRDFWVYFLSN